jgi:predicted membrane channel-forming protein YqfA (hemolysin III family)
LSLSPSTLLPSVTTYTDVDAAAVILVVAAATFATSNRHSNFRRCYQWCAATVTIATTTITVATVVGANDTTVIITYASCHAVDC